MYRYRGGRGVLTNRCLGETASDMSGIYSSASVDPGQDSVNAHEDDPLGGVCSGSLEVRLALTPKDIDAGLAKGAMDNLSATLRVMLALPRTGTCAGSSLVFDGDRSYRLTFADPHKEDLKKSDYNIYEGPSVSCTVEVTPEKGKWRKKPRGWLSIQEQGRQKGALPTIWFGTVAGQPDYAVPVKIRIKTDYGTLLLHLTGVQNRT